MAILIIGLILLLGGHSIRIAAPAWREGMIARLGELPFKGLYSLISLIGILLIVWGFSAASEAPDYLYFPPLSLRHASEALMLPALVLVVASVLPPGHIKRAVRHPLLVATILWAIAHLFVNGDAAGVVLFAAFLVWAIADLIVQRFRPLSATAAPAWRNDAIAIVAGVALYGLLVWRFHFWLFGVSPIV